MTPIELIAALIALGGAGALLVLIRSGRLSPGRSAWWAAVAALVLLVGFFPGLADELGRALGIDYPPVLVLIVAVVILGVKSLSADLRLADHEKRLRVLTQRLAILERREPGGSGDEAASGGVSGRQAASGAGLWADAPERGPKASP